jgi:hypothetical protein
VLVTGGLDPLWEATVAAGADAVGAANVVANQLVGAGVDPSAVDAAELAKLVEARERIPRKAFDEAIAKVGAPGFSAEPYLAQEAVSDAASLEPVVDAILAANPAQVEQYRGQAGRAALGSKPCRCQRTRGSRRTSCGSPRGTTACRSRRFAGRSRPWGSTTC